jgi:subtilisin family serine protease
MEGLPLDAIGLPGMSSDWFTALRVASSACVLGVLIAGVPPVHAAASAPPPTAPREGVVVGAGSPDAKAGSFIVVLRNRTDTASTQSLHAQARALVGDRVRKAFVGLGTFTATMTDLQARRLAADPRVRFVEQNRRIRVAGKPRTAVWGLDRIDQRGRKPSRTYTPTADGSAVRVYVVDTGIRISHPQFGGRAQYGWDVVDGERSANDCNGHGTHVAGTIGGATYGVAKRARLVAVRVLDCYGEGYTDDVIAGVNWVTEHAVKPAVANMSVGGGASDALDDAVTTSIASGITYVVAAGNESEDARNSSPSRVPTAITVGATDSKDHLAEFTNYGPAVDIFAPGVAIMSTWIGSRKATRAISGTSMASPHVAGAAALVLDQSPRLSPAQVRNLLVKRATLGKIKYNWDSANRLLFISPPPPMTKIRTTTVPAAGYGRSYRFPLAVQSPRTGSWSVSKGKLPPGMTMSSTGLITGAPTALGTFRFTATFVDFVPRSTTRTLSVVVRRTPPVIRVNALSTATLGAAYSGRLAVTDNRAGVWTAEPDTLPDGLTVAPSGEVTGVPTVAGALSFPVTFTDFWGQTSTASVSLLVADGEPTIRWDLALPGGIVGKPYSAQLMTVDGRAGVWQVDGDLPPGLVLSPAGRITGIPTEADWNGWTFDVGFTDQVGNTASEQMSLSVDYDDW